MSSLIIQQKTEVSKELLTRFTLFGKIRSRRTKTWLKCPDRPLNLVKYVYFRIELCIVREFYIIMVHQNCGRFVT